ncbi:MAG: hypothetical protein FWC59_01850, partial [Actinomycetia bacterium]|nr:hypothetical protein [Actinomycetes bacterium]
RQRLGRSQRGRRLTRSRPASSPAVLSRRSATSWAAASADTAAALAPVSGHQTTFPVDQSA